MKKNIKIILLLIIIIMSVCGYVIASQTLVAHRHRGFEPDYSKIDLENIINKKVISENDYYNLLLQTGLGKSAIDDIIKNSKDSIDVITKYQDTVFSEYKYECSKMFGWFTKKDTVSNIEQINFPGIVKLLPGDILLSFSTHSVGWTHGHAALVISEDLCIESTVIGSKSQITEISNWLSFSNFVVLRVQGVDDETRKAVADYAKDNLNDIPYKLLSGVFGEKNIATDESGFGVQCSYLVWYAWQTAGVDLDSDGGAIVTPKDILYSDCTEIVQVFNIDPRDFNN